MIQMTLEILSKEIIMPNKGIAIKGPKKKQIAAEIFITSLTAMKELLDAAEWKYECNRESAGYKWYKKNVMDKFYPMLVSTYKHLESINLIVECGCGSSVNKRNGWSQCQACSGCGYKNSSELNDFIAKNEN